MPVKVLECADPQRLVGVHNLQRLRPDHELFAGIERERRTLEANLLKPVPNLHTPVLVGDRNSVRRLGDRVADPAVRARWDGDHLGRSEGEGFVPLAGDCRGPDLDPCHLGVVVEDVCVLIWLEPDYCRHQKLLRRWTIKKKNFEIFNFIFFYSHTANLDTNNAA